jgi:hypothetical protein
MRRPSCRNQRRGGSERGGCRPAHRPLVRTARVTRDTQLGVYEVITSLGERAMGEVHRAPCAMRLANDASVVAMCRVTPPGPFGRHYGVSRDLARCG